MKTNNQSHWILREITEEQAPRATIDLWPQIETRLNPGLKNSQRKTVIRSLKKPAFTLALVLVLFGSLAYVPAVRAFAEDVIQRMGIAFVATDPADQPGQMQELAATVSSAPIPPSPSLAEIQEQLPFRLLVPTWLPDGLDTLQREITRYDPQSWEGSGVGAEISYSRTGDSSGGMLRFEVNDGPITAPPLLAEGREQSVTINGQTGYYVHGSWQSDGTGDPNTRHGDLLWDDQADDAYLTWTQEGVTYLLAANNLGLGLDELTRIAESIAVP